MKTPVLIRKNLPAAILAAALSLGPAVGSTQDKATVSASNTNAPSDAVNATKFNLDVVDSFFGGVGHRKPATIGNLIANLREQDPGLNIVLSPGVAEVEVKDLKLHAADMRSVIWALNLATGGAVYEANLSGPGHWALMLKPVPTFPRQVEAFNVSGYFQQLGTQDEKELESSLEQVENIIGDSIVRLWQGKVDKEDLPVFRFHRGANLLVVIGSPEAIEIARKVVNALPGQGSRPIAGGAAAGAGGIAYVPNVSPPMSKARRNIAVKLENIRLDSVLFDSLPLTEIVRYLNDEARKRDPDKTGVNFLVNPNPPTAPLAPVVAVDPATGMPVTAPAPVAENVDIGSVAVRINPALANVRLVDVLDAIVRVADHPIRYSITDYAVVFSLAGKDAPIPGGPPEARPGF